MPNSTTSPEDPYREAPLAAAGGVPYAAPLERDPIAAWIELMEVVEMLCPRWPEREVVVGRVYLL